MELQHLINLAVMARKGLAVASEQLRPEEAQAVWQAIAEAEKAVKEAQEAQVAQNAKEVENE